VLEELKTHRKTFLTNSVNGMYWSGTWLDH
jgi:hypothetical protein